MIEDFDSLTVSNLSRHYGRRKALSKVTFTCHAGCSVSTKQTAELVVPRSMPTT